MAADDDEKLATRRRPDGSTAWSEARTILAVREPPLNANHHMEKHREEPGHDGNHRCDGNPCLCSTLTRQRRSRDPSDGFPGSGFSPGWKAQPHIGRGEEGQD